MTSDRPRSDADELIKPALHAAVDVARADLTDPDRHHEVPRPIARVAGFRSLSKAALSQVRAALDADERFRERVVEVVAESELDSLALLFLSRPDGWEDELAAAAARVEEEAEVEAEERSAARRLRAAEGARERAEEALQDAQARADALSRELARERDRTADLEQRLAGAALEIAQAKEALEDLGRQLRRAEGKQAEEAHRVDQIAAARDQLRSERDELRAELEALRARGDTPTERRAEEERPSDEGRGPDAWTSVADAVEDAARAAAAMAEGLVEAARRIRPPAVAEDAHEPPSGSDGRRPASPAPAKETRRRRPLPLPPGIFDDSVDAARHLVAVPGVLLLVDGYNASLRRWPQLPIDAQRDRLVGALAELSARCGPAVHVVFDGVTAASRALTGSRGVAVTFTEEGREADDAILDAVEAHPGGPVLVASDDRRVRDGASRLGANVLTLDQLFAVLRREA